MISRKFVSGVHLDIDISGLSPDVLSASHEHSFEGQFLLLLWSSKLMNPLVFLAVILT
jgi:hypothetical protein